MTLIVLVSKILNNQILIMLLLTVIYYPQAPLKFHHYEYLAHTVTLLYKTPLAH